MTIIYFLKARDRHDHGTLDLFGTHEETHVRKDGVAQVYHVKHKPSQSVPKKSNIDPVDNEQGAAMKAKDVVAQPAEKSVWINEWNLDGLRGKVEALQKRAAKLGVPALKMAETGERFMRLIKRDNVIDGYTDKKYIPVAEPIPANWDDANYIKRQVQVSVIGQTPKLAGWTFAAAVEHIGSENVIRAIPGGGQIPSKYHTTGSYCEHCSTKRVRNSTYLVRNEKGDIKQIGSSCMKDFLGHGDAERMAELAASEAALFASFGGDDEYDERDPVGAGMAEGARYDDLINYLPFVAAAIRHFGWTSKSKAEDEGRRSTVGDAAEIRRNHLGDFKDQQPTPDDVAMARDAIEWAKNISDTDAQQSEYLRNLRVIGRAGVFHDRKHAGFAAAIVMSYQKELGRQQEVQRAAKGESTYQGVVGKRQDWTGLTLEKIFTFDGGYGVTHIHRFSDDAGNVFIWKTATSKLDEGKRYNFKATVKAHEEYKGLKQTVLTRVAGETEVEPAPAAAETPIVFIKARDRHDTNTGDMFGTHVETHTRKDGVVQQYHVAAAKPATNTVTSRKRVKDGMEGTHTALTMSNGNTHRIQKLNSVNSMGLPGWHDIDAPAKEPSYLADTEEEAIKVLAGRPAKAAPVVAVPAPAPAADDHPAPIPRRSISHLPDGQRDEWIDLHRQQHEIHYHEMGKTADNIERLNKKLHDARKTAIQHRDEAKLARQHSLPGSDERAEQHDRMAAAAEDEAGKHFRKLDEVSRNHESLVARRDALGARKDAILPGSGDLRTNMASGTRTTLGEEREAAKRYRGEYVAHYKKAQPLAKSIIFLRPLSYLRPTSAP